MLGKTILALAAAASAVAALAARGQGQGEVPDSVDWTIAPASDPGQVRFGIGWRTRGGHSNNSGPIAVAELQGLAPAQLDAAAATDVSFRIARDAGRLDCDGVMRERRGTGTCRFAGDPGFVAALERRGLRRPSDHQLFMLTMGRAELALLDELARHGYATPSLEDYVGASIHGVGIPHVRGMAEAGYRVGTLDKLVNMRIHGVTPAYVAELIGISPRYRGIPADELVNMRIHGVTAARVRGFAEAGYPDLGHEDLMQMSIHGVSPDFIRAMNEAGFGRRTPKQLVQMKIHGLTAEKMRGLAELGYRDLGYEQLLQMAVHGVTPDYVRSLAAAGYADLSPEDLIQMKIHGITAEAAIRANAALAAGD